MWTFFSDKPGDKRSTQISKLFPKQNATAEDEPKRTGRKRSAEVGQPQSAGPSSTKQTKSTTKVDNKTNVDPKKNNNVISKFFHRNEDDESDDFESPKKRVPIIKKKTIPKPTKPKKVSAKTAKQINQIKEKYFSNIVKEHSSRDGVDPDQLQLALAISKSLQPDEEPDAVEESTQVKRSNKQKAVHEIFQRFGFKSGLEGRLHTISRLLFFLLNKIFFVFT